MSAGAGPARGGRRGRGYRGGGGLSLLLRAHLIEILGVHAAHLSSHPHAHKSHSGTGIGIACRRLHSGRLGSHQMGRCPGGSHKGRVALQLLDHLLVFFVGLDAGNAKRDNFHPAKITPPGRKLFVECFGQFQRMAGKGRVADPHFRDFGKSRLKGSQELSFHLPGNLVGFIVLRHIAADIGIKQQRVSQADTVLTETSDGDVQINTRSLIHHPEGDGAGGTVLVAGELLCVEIIDTLIFGCLASKGKALSNVQEHALNGFPQIAGENAGLRGHVVGILSRLSAHVHHFSLFHDEHALAVRHGDYRTVGDDVVITFAVAGASCDFLLSFDRQYIRGDGLAVEEFLPLVRQHAASRSQRGFNQSHSTNPLSLCLLLQMDLVPRFCGGQSDSKQATR